MIVTAIKGLLGAAGGLLSTYLRAIVIAGFVALGSVTGLLWWQKHRAENRVAAQQIDIDRLKGQVAAKEQTIEGQKQAIEALEQTTVTLTAHTAELNTIITEIRNAAPDQDGEIAPLMLRALRSLDGLRDPKR